MDEIKWSDADLLDFQLSYEAGFKEGFESSFKEAYEAILKETSQPFVKKTYEASLKKAYEAANLKVRMKKATKMILEGVLIEKVCKITRLNKEVIEKIAQTLNKTIIEYTVCLCATTFAK